MATPHTQHLVNTFSDALEMAVDLARGSPTVIGQRDEFPQSGWGTFEQTLATQLGSDWLVTGIPAPTQNINYNVIHHPTNTSVSAVITPTVRDGKPMYRVTAIGMP